MYCPLSADVVSQKQIIHRLYDKSLIGSTKKDMLNIKGITEQKAEKIFEAASKIETMQFLSGMTILEKRQKIKRITTGSS